jgi:hypothetical protein
MTLHRTTPRSAKTVKLANASQKAAVHDVKGVAKYIAEMSLELRGLAKSANLKTIQGLLEVTYYEAFDAANSVSGSSEQINKPLLSGSKSKS